MSMKKYAAVIIAIFVVVLGPAFLLSTPGLNFVESFADKKPKSESAPWLLFTIGKTFYYTMRPEEAVDSLSKYVERYPEPKDRRYWDSRYYRALSLGECKRMRDAAMAFWEYMDQSPKDDPNRNEVRKELLSLKSHIPEMPLPD
jgi:hypothetical protein